VLSLLAACGGDRSRAPGGADTTGAAAAMSDSAAMPAPDAGMPRDTSPPATSADSAAKSSAAPAPAPKPAAAAPKTKADTAAKQHAAKPAGPTKVAASPPKPARDSAAPTTAPAAPQPQDTSKATTQPAQSTDTPLRDAYHQAPHDTVTQAVYNGWKQFNLNCARCHGEDALGTTIAPHLIVSLKPDGPINTKELFMQTVCAGRPAKGMPAWCALGLGMDKIEEIYQYVKGRSDAKISPGRPAVKQQG
jgi:hypothetical protein